MYPLCTWKHPILLSPEHHVSRKHISLMSNGDLVCVCYKMDKLKWPTLFTTVTMGEKMTSTNVSDTVCGGEKDSNMKMFSNWDRVSHKWNWMCTFCFVPTILHKFVCMCAILLCPSLIYTPKTVKSNVYKSNYLISTMMIEAIVHLAQDTKMINNSITNT